MLTLSAQRLTDLYAAIDIDGSGLLSDAELRAFLSNDAAVTEHAPEWENVDPDTIALAATPVTSTKLVATLQSDLASTDLSSYALLGSSKPQSLSTSMEQEPAEGGAAAQSSGSTASTSTQTAAAPAAPTAPADNSPLLVVGVVGLVILLVLLALVIVVVVKMNKAGGGKGKYQVVSLEKDVEMAAPPKVQLFKRSGTLDMVQP